MSNLVFDSRSEIPPKPEVPDTSYIGILMQEYLRQRAELAAISKTVKKIQEVQNTHGAKTARLMPGNEYTSLRKHMATQNAAFTEQVFPDGQRISDIQVKGLREARNANVQNYLRQKQLDVDKLRTLNKETTQSMARILKRPAPRRERKLVRILRANEIPEGIRIGLPNPWTIKKPPYDGWAWRYYGWVAGFQFIPTNFLNHAAGFIGNVNYLKDSSAGDSDYGLVDFYTQLAIWFKMPAAGILEVYVEGQPTECQHYCSLYDEWGWSNSSAYQNNYITLQVNSGSTQFSQSSYWWETGYDDGYWNNRYLQTNPPRSYWFHLFSMESYAKDAWVLVKIGTQNYNGCYANDVSTYSEVDFRWYIKKVYIRVT